MKRKLNHLSSSLKRGWPFGTPSCGHCGEGGFHASCITFAPVQTTVQVQPYSKSKTSWAESATSAEGFLLLGCPCWRACPPPCALWSTPWSMALGAGLWPSSHAGLHSTYWDLMTTLLEIRTRWHKTGTSGRFSRMDQLQIPCWWTWPASHFSRCLSLGIECFLEASSLCLPGANASTMETHISSLTNIRDCWPDDELQCVNGVPWKNRS